MSKEGVLHNEHYGLTDEFRNLNKMSEFESLSLCFLKLDLNDIIIEVNKAFILFTHFELDNLIGQHYSILKFKEYKGGQIFGDATTEGLHKDQKIVEFISGDNQKKFALLTQLVSDVSFANTKQILVQNVTHLIQDIEYYEYTSNIAKIGGWEFDVLNKTFRASKDVYEIHEVGFNSFFEIENPFKFYGRSVQDLLKNEFRDSIINQVPKSFECLPFYSFSGKKKWVKLTFIPVVAGDVTIKIFGSLQDISKEIILKEKLKISRERYKNLFDYCPVPLLVIRLSDHKIIQANYAASDFYGYTNDEFLELSALDIRPKNYKEQYRTTIGKKLDDYGDIQVFSNITHQHKNGEHLLVDIYRRGTTLNGQKSKIVLVQDVKAKFEAEFKLSKTNETLSKLIDSSPLAIITVDTNAKIELWNKSAEILFGWTKEEVFEKDIPYVPTNKRKEFEVNLLNSFNIKYSATLELERQKKNGELIRIREHITPLRNEEGNIDRFLLIIEDITESEKVKNALLESERNYRNLVEASNDLIWKLDKNAKITFINHASEEILGYKIQELLNLDFELLLCDDQKLKCNLLHSQVREGTNYRNLELKMITKHGIQKHLNANIYPLYDSTETIVGCAENATDISHIIEQQKSLEAMLKEKEILIKEIHHRVKNNLAVVSSLLTLQAYNQTDRSTINALSESQSRIQSIATIHEQLYQDELFTQIEMGSYLKQLTKDIEETYSSNQKEIIVSVEGDDIFLNVNQAVPFGILTNELVINAFKYAFEGYFKGIITLKLSNRNNQMTLTVSDNGVGLPQQFDPNKEESLGMTLVQSLCEQLGAELKYWTDHGAHFSISFSPLK
jgi:PAS domain S-box-containing protein